VAVCTCLDEAYLCNFSEGPSFLTEINDDATSTFLCLLDCFFNTVDEVRTTCTNITPEHVTSVTLSIILDRHILSISSRYGGVILPRRGL